MQLRQATNADARLLFDWRNDQATRINSRNTAPVAWSTHMAWLTRALENPQRRIYIAELDGQPVGTVRADYGEDCELSWTVAPECRQKGCGKAMVAALADQIRCALVADIKPDNVASQRIATSIGMCFKDGRWLRERRG